jgi:hypothetical protein
MEGCMAKKIYRENDNLITVDGLRDITSSGDYLNSATVEANLYDGDGVLVTPSGGIALSYVADSDGKYEGVIQSTEDLELGQYYVLHIDAAEAGAVGHWEIEVEVKQRRS